MSIYFAENNTFTDKPQNVDQNGFYDWDAIKYKPDGSGVGLLAALGITIADEWNYAQLTSNISAISALTASQDADGIYTDVLFSQTSSGQLTNEVLIKLENTCDKLIENGIWIKWLNGLGGYSYELFSQQIDIDYENDNIATASKYITDTLNSNEKEYSFSGISRQIKTLYKDNIPTFFQFNNTKIDNYKKWLDFKKSAPRNDIFVFNSKFTGTISITDYSSTIAGTVNVYSEDHKQRTGDEVYITDTTNYNNSGNKYKIIVIDKDNFYIIATYISTQTGYFKRDVKYTDWLRCRVDKIDDNISQLTNRFSIKFDILLPSE